MQEISSKNFKVLVTTNFKRNSKPLAKKYKSFKSDLASLVNQLEKKPKTGIPIGKDCYKVRMAIS